MSADCDLHDIAVLVVDDVEDNLDLIEGYLEDEVWSVLRTTSGLEAVRLATEHKPDVVLLDLMMPGMNGFSVLCAIRSVETLHNIGIILQTAYTDKDNILKARRIGCEHILSKPLAKERLLAEIRACLKDRSQHPPADEQPQTPVSKKIATTIRDAQKLIEASQSPGVAGNSETADHLRKLVSADSQIGRQLIRVANSPMYAGRFRTNTVSEAIIRIGIRKTRELIEKASSTVQGARSRRRADEALQLLENITALFPERTSTTEGTLALLRELGTATRSKKEAAPRPASDTPQETPQTREQ